ncbi:GNAT family N-acetyltransferase [Phytobacter sp. AG2a]
MDTKNLFGQVLGKEVKDWTIKPQPKIETLKGSYTVLCQLSVDHAEDLFREWESIDDERDWTYLSDNKPHTKQQCYDYLRGLLENKNELHYSVKDATSGIVKGIFRVSDIDVRNGTFNISEINWTPLMKRTRLSTEALYLIISYFLDILKYRRCEWRSNKENQPAIASAERIGFIKEGVLRDKKINKGRSEDIAIYSIVSTDWVNISPALKNWLRKENFDDRGKQIHKIGELM